MPRSVLLLSALAAVALVVERAAAVRVVGDHAVRVRRGGYGEEETHETIYYKCKSSNTGKGRTRACKPKPGLYLSVFSYV
jgi:hypothetical protein